jgi:hypothetical protein
MDERTPGLETHSDASPRAVVEELGSEVAGVREELDTLLGELDRRRHDALDVRLQLRRHAVGAGLTAFALLATATGSVWRRTGAAAAGRGSRPRRAASITRYLG